MSSGHIRSPIEGALVCAVMVGWSLWSAKTPRPGGFVTREDSPRAYWLIIAAYVMAALLLLWL
jgi:hypothetical protein